MREIKACMQKPQGKHHHSKVWAYLPVCLLILGQTGCQLLPDSTTLLPTLRAANIESPQITVIKSHSAPSAVPLKPAVPKSDKPAQPLSESEPSPAPVSLATAEPVEPVRIFVVPTAATPTPEPEVSGPEFAFQLHFVPRQDSELSASYPVRVSLENARGFVVETQEVFSDELARGFTLKTRRMSEGEAYQIRLAGQVFNGRCLSSVQYLLSPEQGDSIDKRFLTASPPDFSRDDFVAQPVNGACKPALTIYSQVTDSHGNGLAGVQLLADLYGPPKSKLEKGKLAYRQQVRTDNNGNYTLSAFPPGVNVHLSASQGGFSSSEKTLNVYYGLTDSTLERHDSPMILLEE